MEERLMEFTKATKYIDYNSDNIKELAHQLFDECNDDIEKTKIAYEYVRDQIPHSFDCNATTINAKASQVLENRTGICHAKANLLAALLRLQGIPVGICFEHITLANDDSMGYCLHGYNAVYLNNRWIELDARGNKEGVDARFSLDEPILAFPIREEYDEYFIEGVYAYPDEGTMQMLENANSIDDIMRDIPEKMSGYNIKY